MVHAEEPNPTRTPITAADEMVLTFEGVEQETGASRAAYLIVLDGPDGAEDLLVEQVDQWVETVGTFTIISGFVGGAMDQYALRRRIILFRVGDPAPSMLLDGEPLARQQIVDATQALPGYEPPPPENGNGEEPPPENGNGGNGNGGNGGNGEEPPPEEPPPGIIDRVGEHADPVALASVGIFAGVQLVTK